MIDIHTHLHPPRLFAAIRRWFAERSAWRIEHPTEPEQVANTLRKSGVERFVFCSYAHKPQIARELNAWLAQTSRDLAGYGLPLATVHLDDPDCAGDIRSALADGCIGLKIHEDVQRLAVDDPRFDPVFAAVTAADGFVLAHIGPVPWSSDTREGPRRVAAVLKRHAQLRFVVAHMGVPDTHEYLALTARFPNLFVDTTMAFASADLRTRASAPEIEAASNSIVYGSDYPNIPYDYLQESKALAALGLSGLAMRSILRDNARRLSSRLATGAEGLSPTG
jgi:predicted TIM-barrel fold metal-dependent hydrolase